MLTKAKWVGAGLLAIAAVAGPASADVVVLDFEGIAPHPNSNNVLIQDFYNGGTSSNGSSGTNYGVGFSDNALLICLNTETVSCSNTSRGGLAPTSAEGGLFFLSGSSTFLNYGSGFDTGFSFYYSEPNTSGGFVNVWSGLNGSGSLLATINLTLTNSGCPGFSGAYCPFAAIGVGFAGTALSIEFGGVANYVVFDDITFGSVTPGNPGGVPEPATWAMMIGGFGLAGAAMRGRRGKKLATA